MFEKSTILEPTTECQRVFSVNDARLMDLTVSPSEETLLIASSDLALTVFNLANCDVANADDAKCFESTGDVVPCGRCPGVGYVRSQTADRYGGFRPSPQGVGLPRKVCEVSRKFREPPTSVALHPSGLYVLVVFPSQAKLLALLEDEAADVAEVEALGTSHVVLRAEVVITSVW